MRYCIETANAVVAVENGRITGPADDDPLISIPDGHLLPGLINAHDHLHRNHYPRLGRPPYEDAYAWGRDIHEHDAETIERARALPIETAFLFGAFRNLIGGVTTVVHHDRRAPLLDHDFPLRVPAIPSAHSLRFDAAGVDRLLARARARETCTIHVAEGINAAAAAEIDELDARGLLTDGLLAVHAVGLDDQGIERIRQARAAVVWCPVSNLFLFGRTCPPALLRAVDVLLGTDSLLTGSATLLDELRAARELGLLDDKRLIDAVTNTAARRLGLAAPSLETGARADLLVLRAPLLDADVADVALVTVGGVPRVADVAIGEVFDFAREPAAPMTIGGVQKLVSAPLAQAAERVFDEWPDAARCVHVRQREVNRSTRAACADSVMPRTHTP